MDFGLTDEEQMVCDTAHAFAQRHLAPRVREHEADRHLSAETIAGFEETGLTALAGGEMDPDLPVSWPARCELLRTIATIDGAGTLALWSPAIAPGIAADLGVDAELAGQIGCVHLVDDVEALDWPLPWLPAAGAERILLVDESGNWGVAHIDPQPVRSLGLDAATPVGCALLSWAARGTVTAEVIGTACAQLRLWHAAILVGIGRAARDYTARYVQERVTFGKTLSKHQGVAFMYADMEIHIASAEVMLARAAWDLEQGRCTTSGDAWLEAAEAALWVTNHAVQLLGGHGYMRDHPVEMWMRDARALTLLCGGMDAARRSVAQAGDAA